MKFRKNIKPLQLVLFLHLSSEWKIWSHSKFIKKITCLGVGSSRLSFGAIYDNLIFHIFKMVPSFNIDLPCTFWEIFSKLLKISQIQRGIPHGMAVIVPFRPYSMPILGISPMFNPLFNVYTCVPIGVACHCAINMVQWAQITDALAQSVV
jgi:hypothetical protein